ncbi:MAG: outer membrane protein assembly factor BamA [Magnetococcus sp. WYHC-3]
MTPDAILADLALESGSWYSRDRVRQAMERVSELVGNEGYAQVEVVPRTVIDESAHSVAVEFAISKGVRVYVNRIEIEGNSGTRDEVLRREILLSEGDRYSAGKLRESKRRLQQLEYFKEVDITTRPTQVPDRVDLVVKVEEKPTGTFTLGAGYSSVDKLVTTASVSQNNFLGRGQRTDVSFTLSSLTTEFNVSFTEPYFLGRPLSAGVDLFNRELDRESLASYKQRTYGGGLRLGFSVSKNLYDTLAYQYSHVEISRTDTTLVLSPVLQDQFNRSPYNMSMLSNTLLFNTLDNRVLPTSGRVHRLGMDVAGLGGDVNFGRVYLDNSLYHAIWKSNDVPVVMHLRARGGMMDSWDGDVPLFERFNLGGPQSMRGFDSGGIGPRTYDSEGGDALGGVYFGQMTTELVFPLLGLEEHGLRGLTFLDLGVLGDWETLVGNIHQDNDLRMSTGVGVHWNSPFGPLRVSFGFPLMKKDYDETRVFDFSIGTAL